MKLIRFFMAACLYFCLATIIAQVVGIGMFWWKGGFDGNRRVQLLAVVNGLDLYDFWKQVEQSSQTSPEEQIAHEDVLEARVRSSLDWDLREQSIRRAVGELKLLETGLKEERASFDQIRQSFAEELTKRQKDSSRIALQELQETMTSLAPKQAKEQIMMWLENPAEKYPFPQRDVVSDMVQLIKSMPPDRQSKIFKEFKAADETRRLNEILEQIRRGDAQDVIQNTKDQLNENSAQRTPDTLR